MIAYLLKNWKLLLDLILVVGGIIALTIFDPFGLFTNSKLKNTANLVSSVRSIGELVTAEYYGEVIASLHESKIYSIPEDSLYDEFENCYINLRQIVATAVVNENKKKAGLFRRRSKKYLEGVTDSEELKTLKEEYNTTDGKLYDHLIVFLAVENLTGDNFYDEKNAKVTKGTEEQVLKLLIDEFNAVYNAAKVVSDEIPVETYDSFVFDIPTDFNEVVSFHYGLNTDFINAKKRRRKRDIVFIGRGWVKAGFRFNQLDETNFYYDENLKVVRLFGLTPSILDKDINPWFIPEKRVKGFELVDYYKGAQFEEAIQVKKKCKEKLLAQAEGADILNQAKENGIDALESFFSLLLNEPNLTVELSDYPYAQEYEMIAADTLVTVAEAQFIQELYDESIGNDVNQSQGEIDEERRTFDLFLNRLKKLAFVEKDFTFSLLSLEAAKFLEHTLFLSQQDYDSAKQNLRKELKASDGALGTAFMDQLPLYTDYTHFTQDFNEMLQVIDRKMQDADSVRSDTLLISMEEFDDLKLDTTYFFVDPVANDSILKVVHKGPDVAFSNLRYPIVTLNPKSFTELSISDTTEVLGIIEAQVDRAQFLSGDSTLQALVDRELQTIETFKKTVYPEA